MRIALFQPDIPQNTGATIRLCACLGVSLDIIEPCGFIMDDRRMGKAAMDYAKHVDLTKHLSWDHFVETMRPKKRFILMTTKASLPYTEIDYTSDDILIAGRESSGVPENVHETCDERVFIPMDGATRSLNVVTATAIITGEALRQIQKRNT